MLYLYDPRTNILTETDYTYLVQLTGKSRHTLYTLKSRGKKIRGINCYLTDDKVTVKQRKEWYEKEKFKDEVWKPIEGTEGKYYVSNHGRFKRLFKYGFSLLLPYMSKKKGIMLVKLRHYYGRADSISVSKLVGLHFVGKPKKGEVFYHKNGIKTDNFSGNIGIITRKELGRKTAMLSRARAVVKVNPDTMEVVEEFRSAREAGRRCYLSYQAVMDSCNYKTNWNSSGYLFRWTDEFLRE